jgi:hypothetical protein
VADTQCSRSEVLTTVHIKITVIWDVKLSSLVELLLDGYPTRLHIVTLQGTAYIVKSKLFYVLLLH